MYTSETTVRVIRAPSEHRFAATAALVRAQWIPAQSAVQREIREALKAGAYDENRLLLCDDLQRDPATLFQFLRVLPGFVPESEHALGPLAALQAVPTETLGQLLTSTLRNRSVHQIRKGNSEQRDEIARAILTNSATRTLLEHENHGGETSDAGIVAHLRSLGRLLVSWNYPRVFQRARRIAHDEHVTFDLAVEKVLGMTPQALGFSTAREWGLHPDLLRCLSNDPNRKFENSGHYQECGNACGLAERFVDCFLLATPKEQDSAEIKKAQSDLVQQLNPELLRTMRATIQQECSELRQKLAPVREPLPTDAATKALKLSRSDEMTPSAKAALEEFIRSHAEHRSVRGGLEQIIRIVIPGLGFTRGCLYMLDQTQTRLVPAVQIGAHRSQGYPSIIVDKRGIIAESLFSDHPYVQDSGMLDNEIVSVVTGSTMLLGQQIVLTLFWENPDTLQGNPAALFKAIAMCFKAIGDAGVIEKNYP